VDDERQSELSFWLDGPSAPELRTQDSQGDTDRGHLGAGRRRPTGDPNASCAGTLREYLTARLIGGAEARAAGFSCDGFAGLGGGSAPSEGGGDASGGDAGLDVQLICGSIKDVLSGPDAGEGDPCTLAPCEQVFSLTGERQ
jgi:hypothetical protein